MPTPAQWEVCGYFFFWFIIGMDFCIVNINLLEYSTKRMVLWPNTEMGHYSVIAIHCFMSCIHKKYTFFRRTLSMVSRLISFFLFTLNFAESDVLFKGIFVLCTSLFFPIVFLWCCALFGFLWLGIVSYILEKMLNMSTRRRWVVYVLEKLTVMAYPWRMPWPLFLCYWPKLTHFSGGNCLGGLIIWFNSYILQPGQLRYFDWKFIHHTVCG